MLQDNLKKIREELGISQKEMAARISIPQAQYSRYELGTNPSAEILEKLVKNLRINVNYILTGEGAMFITPELEKKLMTFKIPRNARVILEVEE